MTDEPIASVVVVQHDEFGELHYHVFGGSDVRLFIVDERAPHDRVYEWTPRSDPSELRRLIPAGSEIGSNQDQRHAAIAARVNALVEGTPRLSVVDTLAPAHD